MSLIPMSVEEDFYGSASTASASSAASSAASLLSTHTVPYAVAASNSYMDTGMIHRAWTLRLRPIRTTCFSLPPPPSMCETQTPVSPNCVAVYDVSSSEDTPYFCERAVEVLPSTLSEVHTLQTIVRKAYHQMQMKLYAKQIALLSLPPAIVTGLSFTKCQVDPVPTEQSIMSHIRVWENGTFTFQPRQIQAAPCVFLGLDERRVGTEPEDVDLALQGFDLQKPFTIVETRQTYSVQQEEKQIVIPRTGMIRGRERFERQEIPLSISFSDISFDITFEMP